MECLYWEKGYKRGIYTHPFVVHGVSAFLVIHVVGTEKPTTKQGSRRVNVRMSEMKGGNSIL